MSNAKTSAPGVERRNASAPSKLRIESRSATGSKVGEFSTLSGYAAVYNQLSHDLGHFRERIKPGAFASALKPGVDVRAFFDHSTAFVLGRTTAGTLRLFDDAYGLRVQIDLPDTQIAADLKASVSRGDINQMSFGFVAKRTSWTDETIDGLDTLIRNLHEVELIEISVVAIPAYPQTFVGVEPPAELMKSRSRSAMTSGDAARLSADWLVLLEAMKTI